MKHLYNTLLLLLVPFICKSNSCDQAIPLTVQQIGDAPIYTDMNFSTGNSIENYGGSSGNGGYAWCVPSGSNANNIAVIDNFYSFVAPSTGSVIIILEDDITSDMEGSIRSSCSTINNPVFTCLNGFDDNNFVVTGLVPGETYILNFMLEPGGFTTVSDADNQVSIFGVENFELDCPSARITEVHYENTGNDEGEFIEITALGGESLAGYTVEVHYSGSGVVPESILPTTFILDGNSTPVPGSDNSTDTISFPESYEYFGFTFYSFLPNSPTTISLRNPSGVIVDLISYEGNFNLVDGLVPNDIMVVENGLDPIVHSLRAQDIIDHSQWVRNINTSPNAYNSEMTLVIESSTAIWQGGNGMWDTNNWNSSNGFSGLSIYQGTEVSIPSGEVTIDNVLNDNLGCFNISGDPYYETIVKSIVVDGDLIITENGELASTDFVTVNGSLDLKATLTSPTSQVADLKIGDGVISSANVVGDLQIDDSFAISIDGLAGAGMSGGNDFLSVSGLLEINAPISLQIIGSYPTGTEIPIIGYGSLNQMLDESLLPAGWILEIDGASSQILAVKAERPINDLCSGSINLPLAIDNNQPSISNSTNLYALPDESNACGSIENDRGVWYSFSVSESNTYSISVSNFTSNVSLQLFEGDCSNPNSLSCGNEQLAYLLESGTPYYLLVTTSNNQFSNFDLTFTEFETNIEDVNSVGINIEVPITTFDVNGSIRIGNDSIAIPGALRYRRNSFEGFDGAQWKSLDASNDNLGNHKANQNLDLNGNLISNVLTPQNEDDAANKGYVDIHEDGDADSSNEIQTLSISGNDLSISNANTITLPELPDPNWNDMNNIPSDFADGIDNTIDSDSDSNNERISSVTLSGTQLNIEEVSTTQSVDLAPISTQWTDDGDDIYINDNVGIGITDPQRELDVDGTVQIIKNSTSGNPQLHVIESNTGASRIYLDNSIDDPIALLGQPNADPDDAKFTLFVEGDVLTALGSQRIGINNTNPDYPLEVGTNTTNGNGAHVTAGGTWTNGSSRTFKESFESIKYSEILTKLAAVDILLWNYKGSDEGQHLGPIAEEFYEAFGLGGDERYISTIDADGVSLAAIKALYEENQQLKNKIAIQEKFNDKILKRLEALERSFSKEK